MNNYPSWEIIEIQRKKLFIWGIAILVPIYLFTSLALVQFLCMFFLFILIGSRLYTEHLIKNIRVIRNDMELRVFRHEWVRVELKIENHGLLPAFMLVANDLPGDVQVFNMQKIFCTLSRRSWILFHWDGLCADRGIFSTGPAVIRGSDPLGLFPFHLTAGEKTRLFVYPVIRSISLKNSKGIPLGNLYSDNYLFEDITRYRSLRPYNPGDEPRRINWKASAHVSGNTQQSGGLLINEFDATASYPLMIFLNMEQNDYHRKNRSILMERVIEAAAAICLKASKERQEFGIIIYTSSGEDGISVIAPSAHTIVPILEHLAAIDWTKPTNAAGTPGGIGGIAHNAALARNTALVMLNQGKRLPYGTRYIYAGPDLGDEAYFSLNSLKKYHVSLEYLVIDERHMPSLVPGNSPRYQIKESGYEII